MVDDQMDLYVQLSSIEDRETHKRLIKLNSTPFQCMKDPLTVVLWRIGPGVVVRSE